MLPKAALACLLTLPLTITVPVASAQDFVLVIKDHRFDPTELQVPAGQKLRLVVKNGDATPEEFESNTLNREKVIPGNGEATILIGPLEPGRYEFFGEFHQDSAKGVLIAQ